MLLIDPLYGNYIVMRDTFERAWLNNRYAGRIGFIVKRHDQMLPTDMVGPTATNFIVNLAGDGELLISNAEGEKIGILNGLYVDEILDAEMFFSGDNQDTFLGKGDPSNEYYYFYKNTEVTAEIYGNAAGKYEFVIMTGNDVFRLDVPTAENVNDSILVNESGEFSIKFDSQSNRNGEYLISIIRNSNGWTQFKAPRLPVIPGGTFTYQVDWDALRASKNWCHDQG